MQFAQSKCRQEKGLEKWQQGRLFAAETSATSGPVARRVVDLDAVSRTQPQPDLAIVRSPRSEPPARRRALDLDELAAAMQKSRARTDAVAVPQSPPRRTEPAGVPTSVRGRVAEAIGIAVAMACCVATAVLA